MSRRSLLKKLVISTRLSNRGVAYEKVFADAIAAFAAYHQSS